MTLKSLIFATGLVLTPLYPASAQTPAAEVVSAESFAAQADALHQNWTDILSRYVRPDSSGINLVDYASLKAHAADRAALADYIDGLADLPLSDLPADDQFAAWANLYNALTVQLIVDNYPVASIRDIKSGLLSFGPWGRKLVEVESEMLTLDNIEHDILRERYDDPRVHYAVNCASMGCPNLQLEAWRGETLDDALNQAARDYINHPRGVSLRSDGKLEASNIFEWYKEDFGNSEAGVLEHMRKYASPETAAILKEDADIRKYVYDWDLNEVATGADE